jgi:hypothetical protein
MVTVCNGTAELIVQREALEDLVRHDIVPERLAAQPQPTQVGSGPEQTDR